MRWAISVVALALCSGAVDVKNVDAGDLELSTAVVLSASSVSRPETKAVQMLVGEVEKRSQIRWPQTHVWPVGNSAVIVVARQDDLKNLAGLRVDWFKPDTRAEGPEGFQIQTGSHDGRLVVLIVGKDARGVLYGVGRLLRILHLQRQSITISDEVKIATKPRYRLRGHQLGYRPKTNSYDAWDEAQWEQYLRDLVVFGANAIELIPPRSDDDADSPHFVLPPMEMMERMSRLADDYGMDVWIWYPAMDRDYADPATVESAIKEWAEVFRKLPRIDAVFVPGGDPGHTEPKYLLAMLERQKASLRRFHPRAQMWVSPQSFNQAWLDEFLGILRDQQPGWLDGVVFGPQIRMSIEDLRRTVPARYPIRNYPDITHSRQCELPVPDWDTAYAVTEAREVINPRPTDEALVFHRQQTNTIGFISYSEGCNDDVNKAIWSALGWDPDEPVNEILRDYGRYFVGDAFADDFANGLLDLEHDWRGPLATNERVENTLNLFQAMEQRATPPVLRNWRFQQGLYRACYDAYTRRRLRWEASLENDAMDRVRDAVRNGSLVAMQQAGEILDRATNAPVAPVLRQRIFTLAEALFQSIGMQLSVKRYQAISVDRGASLDTLDVPLNNRPWLEAKFAAIREMPTEDQRLRALAAIVHWTDPGPGGFYDDLGNVAKQPHLVRGKGFAGDPSFLRSSLVGFEDWLVMDEPDEKLPTPLRYSWLNHAESLFDAPLEVHYTGLDTKANYRVRVVYAGDSPRRKIRLEAGDGIEVHPFIEKPWPIKPVEFDVPAAATAGGALTLRWYREPSLGGNGRGCQVSEVWLLRK